MFYPFTLIIGVPPSDAFEIAKLIGERAVLTEVKSYQDLSLLLSQGALKDPRSAVLAAYALCGFAHIASLKYSQRHKGLKIYAYVFMINHMHIIASSPDMIGFVRDYKKYISKEIQNSIIATEPNVLNLFHLENGKYEVWSKTNMPKMIENGEYLIQKINYIHENPVRRQYVKKPEDWVWSSANPESDIIIDPMVL